LGLCTVGQMMIRQSMLVRLSMVCARCTRWQRVRRLAVAKRRSKRSVAEMATWAIIHAAGGLTAQEVTDLEVRLMALEHTLIRERAAYQQMRVDLEAPVAALEHSLAMEREAHRVTRDLWKGTSRMREWPK